MKFVKYADRLMSIICEEGFAYSTALTAINTDQKLLSAEEDRGEYSVTTPTGATFSGDYFCICFFSALDYCI